METWDAYDKDFNKVHNATLIRGEAIPEGLFHLVCDIIVKHTDGSYLLMQRDRCKQFGGMWEATAGGSALQNESPLKIPIVFLFVLKMGNSDWNCPLIALIMRFFLACTDFCIN